jgi:hypothetical protein
MKECPPAAPVEIRRYRFTAKDFPRLLVYWVWRRLLRSAPIYDHVPPSCAGHDWRAKLDTVSNH